jgi:hypothetical protein
MLPGSEKKINEMFAKEYKLTEDQQKAITEISKNETFSKNHIPGWDPTIIGSHLPEAQEIKDNFKDLIKDNTYITLLTT